MRLSELNISPSDAALIGQIARRAIAISKQHGVKRHPGKVIEDVARWHARSPIRLAALLDGDDLNFVHDVFGIIEHSEPENRGRCFMPRFSDYEAIKKMRKAGIGP